MLKVQSIHSNRGKFLLITSSCAIPIKKVHYEIIFMTKTSL